MPTLRILVPDATENYIKNPAMRYATTGWTALGSTITRSSEQARWNVASLKVVTNGTLVNEGAYYRVTWLTGIQSVLAASIYVRGTGYARIRLTDNLSGKEWSSEACRLRTDRWQRISVDGRCTGGNDVRLYVETDRQSAVTFYADGAQLEPHVYPTTYCDGDQPGCNWTVYEHGSISNRDAYTRLGGRWLDMLGENRADDNLYLTVIGGLGMAPITNNIQPYSHTSGSYFQDTKTNERIINITFHAKQENFERCTDNSLAALHGLRQTLIDIIKPDKTYGSEEFTLEYTDGKFPVYLKVRYDGGLEGDWDVRNSWINSFAVRFIAVSPYLYEDDQDIQELDIRQSGTVNYAMQRLNGAWSDMNGGLSAVVSDFKIGPRGEIIACGVFNKANNDPGAISPEIFVNFIAYWDGTEWHQYGSGANNYINAIAVAPNGYIYATGAFTSIGGVAANRVAYWDGSAWNAMGTGLADGAGFAIEVAPDGNVYVGGSFTQAGGQAMNYIARWDGVGSWHQVGYEPGMNAAVYSIAIAQDGTVIYFGGAFTDEYGSPGLLELNYVAEYDPYLNEFYALESGLDNTVRKMVLTPVGTLYVAGDFTVTGAADPETMLYIGYWSGSAWYPLGAGANNIVRSLDVSGGTVLAAGDFTGIGGIDGSVAMWNETTWVNLDADMKGNDCYAVRFGRNGADIFLSPNGVLADWAGITLVENKGTAQVAPKIYIVGPCTVRWIENQTVQKRVYADMDIANNETVIIDFSTGKMISNVRGDIAYAVSAGSDIRSWVLTPGQNKIAIFLVDDVAAKAYVLYEPQHWSGDATNTQKEL